MKNNLPTITLKRDAIKNIDSIQLYFKYNDQLLSIIRGLNRFKWSASRRCWHGPFNPNNLKLIRDSLDEAVKKFMVNGNAEDYLRVGAWFNECLIDDSF